MKCSSEYTRFEEVFKLASKKANSNKSADIKVVYGLNYAPGEVPAVETPTRGPKTGGKLVIKHPYDELSDDPRLQYQSATAKKQRNTTTNRMLENNAREMELNKGTIFEYIRTLREHWYYDDKSCNNYRKSCFIKGNEEKKHYPLLTTDINKWAKRVMDRTTSYHHPPTEVMNLLRERRKEAQKKRELVKNKGKNKAPEDNPPPFGSGMPAQAQMHQAFGANPYMAGSAMPQPWGMPSHYFQGYQAMPPPWIVNPYQMHPSLPPYPASYETTTQHARVTEDESPFSFGHSQGKTAV